MATRNEILKSIRSQLRSIEAMVRNENATDSMLEAVDSELSDVLLDFAQALDDAGCDVFDE